VYCQFNNYFNLSSGLIIGEYYTVLTLIITNILNLESISIAGSVGFLLIFATVNYVGFRLSKKISGNRIIPFLGFILCSVALVTLVIQQYTSNRLGVIVAISIVFGCFLLEWGYKNRRIKIETK